jgi:hypothetical protein
VTGELSLYAADDFDALYADFGEQGINVTADEDVFVGVGLLI